MNEAGFFETEVEEALDVLKKGGVILYPTDTIWGIGCDATSEEAVMRIYQLKKREDSKSMIILMADEREVLQYVAAPDLAVFDFLEEQTRPTTIIFEGAIGLPSNLIAADGSIAIRMSMPVTNLAIDVQRPMKRTLSLRGELLNWNGSFIRVRVHHSRIDKIVWDISLPHGHSRFRKRTIHL